MTLITQIFYPCNLHHLRMGNEIPKALSYYKYTSFSLLMQIYPPLFFLFLRFLKHLRTLANIGGHSRLGRCYLCIVNRKTKDHKLKLLTFNF